MVLIGITCYLVIVVVNPSGPMKLMHNLSHMSIIAPWYSITSFAERESESVCVCVVETNILFLRGV